MKAAQKGCICYNFVSVLYKSRCWGGSGGGGMGGVTSHSWGPKDRVVRWWYFSGLCTFHPR